MEFLLNNPLLILALILSVMGICAYFIIKPRKKTADNKSDKNTKKSDKSDAVKKTEESKSEDTTKSEPNSDSESKTKEKKKLKKLKSEITRVYEKKQLQTKSETKTEDTKELEEQELLKKMQFVKTSKTVSKLKPYDGYEELLQDESFVQVAEENLQDTQIQNEKQSRINKPKKLSESIKNDNFDDIFCSHITDKYMRMDFERHLYKCDEFQEKLFRRAADTLANSDAKVSISDDGKVQELPDKDSMKSWLEEKRRENIAQFMVQDQTEKNGSDYEYEDIVKDEFDLNARTMLVVDSILNRKGKNARKK